MTAETVSTEIVTETEIRTTGPKYKVLSVEKTEPPKGLPEGLWHRYVIGQDDSRIEGFKPGSLQTVTRHAEEFAENLNARASKGYSTYAARKPNK